MKKKTCEKPLHIKTLNKLPIVPKPATIWFSTLWQSFVTVFTLFLSTTSLHGVKHIVTWTSNKTYRSIEKNYGLVIGNTGLNKRLQYRSIFQSSLWIIVTTVGLLFSIYLMLLVWIRFQTQPTVTTVETINYPIWDVPFPAVTVCNINKVQRKNTSKIQTLLYVH